MPGVITAVVLAFVLALVLRLLRRRRGRKLRTTPLGGIAGDFQTPYRVPGRRRSGRGF